MKSNEYIKQLIKLSEENPELEIIARVTQECTSSEDHSWYGCNFGESEIVEYWLPSDAYFFEEDEIKEELEYNYHKELSILSDEDREIFIDIKYYELKKSGEIKKAIFVTIQP